MIKSDARSLETIADLMMLLLRDVMFRGDPISTALVVWR